MELFSNPTATFTHMHVQRRTHTHTHTHTPRTCGSRLLCQNLMINRSGFHHCLGNVRRNYAKYTEDKAKAKRLCLSCCIPMAKPNCLCECTAWVCAHVLVCMCFPMSSASSNAACHFSRGQHLTWLDNSLASDAAF